MKSVFSGAFSRSIGFFVILAALFLFACPEVRATTTTTIYGVPLSAANTKVIARVDTQALATQASTMTKVQLKTENKDTRTEFSTSLYKFVAKSPGTYLVGANTSFTASDNGTRQIVIYKNGAATPIAQTVPSAANAPAIKLSISGVLDLIATDYLELYARQSSGESITLDNETEFYVLRLN